jgi:hypothetical protein
MSKKNRFAKSPAEEAGKKDDRGARGQEKKPTGVVPELPMFDWSADRIETSKFYAVKKALIDYVGVKYSPVENVFMYDEHYVYTLQAAPDLTNPLNAYMYNKVMDCYIKSTQKYNENSMSVFALVYGQCTLSMRNKITENPNWTTIQKNRDLLGLWKTIKEACTRGRESSAAPTMKTIAEAEERLSKVRQVYSESVAEFYEKFQNEIDLAEQTGIVVGPRVDKIAGQTDPEHEQDMKEAREKKLAMMFLMRLDKPRFGNMLVDLENNRNMIGSDDCYPATMHEAYQLACNRREYYVKKYNSLRLHAS